MNAIPYGAVASLPGIRSSQVEFGLHEILPAYEAQCAPLELDMKAQGAIKAEATILAAWAKTNRNGPSTTAAARKASVRLRLRIQGSYTF